MQRLIHWLEVGEGRGLLLASGVILAVVLASLFLSHKRYRGPSDEATFTQLIVAESLASGEGFQTRVRYPQAVAFNEAQGEAFDPGASLPELYHAPLYALVLGGGMAMLPERLRAWLWAEPDGQAFRADFFVLAVNLAVFWVACLLLWLLAKRLFHARAAWVALAGCLLSVSVWEGVLSVTGVVLLMALVLGLLLAVYGVEVRGQGRSHGVTARLLLVGVLCGGLFLADYAAGLVLLPVLCWAGWRFRRATPVLLVLLGAVLVAGPWVGRNVMLTGSPVGLAWQELGLRAGDPTASPGEVRTRLHAGAPEISLRKVINKGLDGMKENLRAGLWTGGALVFSAFFVAGFFYRFRRQETEVLRWLAVAVVAVMLLGQPFLDDGEGVRLPAQWLAPLLIIFGAGFFLVLIESTAQRSAVQKAVLVAVLLGFQGLPLVHLMLEPARGAYYAYPPYSPRLMHLMKTGLKERFYENFGLMSDVPAGAAWYSGEFVWAQPAQYRDFDGILDYQAIGALYLSPAVLDRPFFGELVHDGGRRSWQDPERNHSWGAIYAGLPRQRVPAFFPLQRVLPVWDNTIILMDTRALSPDTAQRTSLQN